ncbi:hypothetical protein DPX16_22352 [Anabarilius grahami]|uniref:Uncharacterized protein n=1 Tax=Anabarilius grahami TaxID=495550 RepID=A0A3N0YRL0_ANAGA|nr:hypothetical protein DPX16_22352 [Anabarilius grahami]
MMMTTYGLGLLLKLSKTEGLKFKIDNEEEYEDDGERQTQTVTKVVKKYVPHRTYQPATPEQVDKWSKDLPDMYKQPQKAWQFLQRRPMPNENLTSDSLVQTDERLSLAVHNAKDKVDTSRGGPWCSSTPEDDQKHPTPRPHCTGHLAEHA